LVNGALGSVFGLPGRATGGTVAPGRGYLVGERGPELFIPASAGRIDASAAGPSAPRDVRVAIQLTQPRGSSAPQALQRSARQVASAVRRAMQPG
jgi:phage-related minor tail protein